MKKCAPVVLVTILSLGMVACGSGGGKDNGGSSGSSSSISPNTPITEIDPKNVPPAREAEWKEYVEKFEQSSNTLIAGIYNVTTTDVNGKKDVAYVYIDKDLKSSTGELVVSAYNFMNDDVDSEGSCYRYAAGNHFNAKLNGEPGMNGKGSTLKWVEPWDNAARNSSFVLEIDGQKISWELDKFINITGVSLGSIRSGSHLIVDSQNIKLSLTANKEVLGNISISTIQSNLCKGESVNESTIGNTNFSGLYDTSVMEGSQKYESYMYIDAQGKIFSYKYMGDGYLPTDNKNCYDVSPIYNRDLHGKSLSYDKAANRLVASVDEIELYWNLNDNGEIISVGSASTSSGDRYENSGRSISISAIKAFPVSDLQAAICN